MRTDILFVGGDLGIVDGDWVVGASDPQHVQHIITVPQGGYKQFPLTGVGEARIVNAPITGALRRDIQMQLEGDGLRLINLQVDLGNQAIQIDFE